MGKGFDEYASAYDAWFLENRNVLYSEVNLVASTLRDAGRILSVGCGSGLFEKILREEYDIRITDGIEPSTGMADIARKRGLEVTVGNGRGGRLRPRTLRHAALQRHAELHRRFGGRGPQGLRRAARGGTHRAD